MIGLTFSKKGITPISEVYVLRIVRMICTKNTKNIRTVRNTYDSSNFPYILLRTNYSNTILQ